MWLSSLCYLDNIISDESNDKKELVEYNLNILKNKEKELAFKELLVDKMSNIHNNIDLLDELTRLKLGYSGKGEIVISLE